MIESLKDLKNLLKLCRQNGVTEITVGSCSLKLGEPPVSANLEVEEMDEADGQFIEAAEAPLTHEEAVAWAAGA